MEHQETASTNSHEPQGSSVTPLHAISQGETSRSATSRQESVTRLTSANTPTGNTTPRPRRGQSKIVRFAFDDEFERKEKEKERTRELYKRREAAVSKYSAEGYLGLPLEAFPDLESFSLVTPHRTDVLAKVDWEDGESFKDIVRVADSTAVHHIPGETDPRPTISKRLQDPVRTLRSQGQLYEDQRTGHWVEPDDGSNELQPRQQNDQSAIERSVTGEAGEGSSANQKEKESAENADEQLKKKLSDARREFKLEANRYRNSIMAAIDGVRNILVEEQGAETGLIKEAIGPRKHRTTYQWPVHETLLTDPSRHAVSSSAKPADIFETRGIAYVDRLLRKPSAPADSEFDQEDNSAMTSKAPLTKKRKRGLARKRKMRMENDTDDTPKDEAPRKKPSSSDTYPAGIIKVRTKVQDPYSLHGRILTKEEQMQQWKLDRHAARRAPKIHQVFEDEVIAFAQKMYRQGSAFRVEDLDALQELTMPKYRIQAVRSSKPNKTQSQAHGTAQEAREAEQRQALESNNTTEESLDELEWADDELTALQEKAAVFSAEDTMRRVLQRLPYVIRQGALGYKPSFVSGDFERRWETVLLAANLGGVEERILKKVSMRMSNLLSTAQQLRYLTVRTKKPPSFEEHYQELAEAKEDQKHNRTLAILELIQQTERAEEFYETAGERFKKDMYLKHLWDQHERAKRRSETSESGTQEDESEGQYDSLPMQERDFDRIGQLLQARTAWNEQVEPDPLHPGNDYEQLVKTAEEQRQLHERDLLEFTLRWS
ncbi:hypothetical protein BGW41_006250 [Actinomortierella wolfii]|nr:hypothetical protein BGW41_006250 [Actinomortierella wolfii]